MRDGRPAETPIKDKIGDWVCESCGYKTPAPTVDEVIESAGYVYHRPCATLDKDGKLTNFPSLGKMIPPALLTPEAAGLRESPWIRALPRPQRRTLHPGEACEDCGGVTVLLDREKRRELAKRIGRMPPVAAQCIRCRVYYLG